MIISRGNSEAEISASGGYIMKLKLDGNSILSPGDISQKTHGGCAILFPFPNRIRSASYVWNGINYHLKPNDGINAIHGLVNAMEFRVEKHETSSLTLSGTLSDSGYPSTLDIRLNYSLGISSLKFSLEAMNTGNSSCPVSFGMHPYFLHGGYWSLRGPDTYRFMGYKDGYFPDGTYSIIDQEELSSQSGRSFDNCFELESGIELVTALHKMLISGNHNRYYVIYNGKWAGKSSVALEPMSAPPDSFNNRIGIIELNPGMSVTFEEKFTVSKQGIL